MLLKELVKALETWAPVQDAEDFDNVGLLIGDKNIEVKKGIVTLDITDEVMNQAIEENADVIITFHPLIFKGLKKLSGNSRIERLVVKAIQHNIAIYAIHTNLDAQLEGVNGKICERLGLKNNKILMPKEDNLFKLSVFIPNENLQEVREAIFATGAGTIGNYAECSFNLEGLGTFKPIENANPTTGKLNELHTGKEVKVEFLVEAHLINDAIVAMKKAHPYEEVAYDIYPLQNKNHHKGMGQIGVLAYAMDENEFLEMVKKQLTTECVRHSNLLGKKIKKVAVLGGSGAFGINTAISVGADAYVTADLKYHDFFLADNKILLCDVGHYESEQFTKNHITHYISEKFPNFAILTSEINTNPINYYT